MLVTKHSIHFFLINKIKRELITTPRKKSLDKKNRKEEKSKQKIKKNLTNQNTF